MEIFYVLTKYIQSRLLQNCRMRERVNDWAIGTWPRLPEVADPLTFYFVGSNLLPVIREIFTNYVEICFKSFTRSRWNGTLPTIGRSVSNETEIDLARDSPNGVCNYKLNLKLVHSTIANENSCFNRQFFRVHTWKYEKQLILFLGI